MRVCVLTDAEQLPLGHEQPRKEVSLALHMFSSASLWSFSWIPRQMWGLVGQYSRSVAVSQEHAAPSSLCSTEHWHATIKQNIDY